MNNISPKGSISPCLVNVGDSSEEGTEDDLGVIFEEVYLHCSIGQMHHHSTTGPEPGLEGGNTGQLVLFSNLMMESKLHIIKININNY